MKKLLFVLTGVVLFFVAGLFVFAQQVDPLSQITYPVAELGNCQTREACESYCDQPENMAPCLDFAESHNLISPEELALARKMLAVGETGGPGNCRGQAQCQTYCDDINNIEECLVFGEEHGLIPADELADGKKVMAAIKQGIKPPNCRSKKECDVYCGQSENMEECLVFGEAAGLIPAEELGEARKVLAAVKKGAKLPGCRGKTECDLYCSQDEHFQECLDFAEAAGFMSPEEAERARQGMEMMQQQRSSGPEGFPEIPGQIPGQLPEGMTLPEEIRQQPTPEEIEKMKQEGQPQSFLERAQNFLADTLFLLHK